MSRRLLIRPGTIGDFIVSLPALESLRTDYLELWTASAHLPLARFADRARAIASTGLDLLGIVEPEPRLLASLRGFDSIVSWYGANRPDFRALVDALGLPFHFLDALPPAEGPLHAIDFYLRQAGGLGGRRVETVPRVVVPARQREGAVLHPFSGSPRKNWPLERFRQLGRELERILPVAWCAGPEDELSEDAIRIPNLYDLACRLAEARVFVGNDSGIAHLAAAVGTPAVVLFGPTDPRVWAPRGEQVRVVAAPRMDGIEPAAVLAAVGCLIK